MRKIHSPEGDNEKENENTSEFLFLRYISQIHYLLVACKEKLE
jgi:hypothetical protein